LFVFIIVTGFYIYFKQIRTQILTCGGIVFFVFVCFFAATTFLPQLTPSSPEDILPTRETAESLTPTPTTAYTPTLTPTPPFDFTHTPTSTGEPILDYYLEEFDSGWEDHWVKSPLFNGAIENGQLKFEFTNTESNYTGTYLQFYNDFNTISKIEILAVVTDAKGGWLGINLSCNSDNEKFYVYIGRNNELLIEHDIISRGQYQPEYFANKISKNQIHNIIIELDENYFTSVYLDGQFTKTQIPHQCNNPLNIVLTAQGEPGTSISGYIEKFTIWK
jgi:hypothetical protein